MKRRLVILSACVAATLLTGTAAPAQVDDSIIAALQSARGLEESGDLAGAVKVYHHIAGSKKVDKAVRAIAGLHVIRSLDLLERDMDVAERIALVNLDDLPRTYHGEAFRLQMKADLIRGRFTDVLDEAAAAAELPLSPAQRSAIRAYEGEALQRLGKHDEAMAAYTHSIFFNSAVPGPVLRKSIDQLIGLLNKSGRLAEAEEISRMRSTLLAE